MCASKTVFRGWAFVAFSTLAAGLWGCGVHEAKPARDVSAESGPASADNPGSLATASSPTAAAAPELKTEAAPARNYALERRGRPAAPRAAQTTDGTRAMYGMPGHGGAMGYGGMVLRSAAPEPARAEPNTEAYGRID